ncbi:MAG TPA: gamma-glutamyltransferase, partial [Thermoanaerobaculia bacterium]
DLASYAPVWRDPLTFKYRGNAVTSMPPPSSGGVALAMTAGMLRDVEVGKLAWHGTEHVHWLAEVWKRVYATRNEVLGDPAFVKDMPIAKLLAPATHAALVKTIGERATPSKDVPPLREGTHTTHLSVVDASGQAVALTTTLNTSFGNGVTVPGAGFLLNNEMDDFTAKPGSPNTYGLVQGAANKIEPGKRMLSSMTPTIVEDPKGQVTMVLGGQGGSRIITAVWQALSNVVDFGQPVAAAVANPRVHHQHLPDVLQVEPSALDRATEAQLRAKGHVLEWSPTMRFGSVTMIVRAPNGWAGAADPRKGGAAMGD